MDIKFSKPYYNVATEGNTVALEEAYNVYFEALPQGGFAIRRRPGMTLAETTIQGLAQGIYWSDRKERLYFVVDGNLYEKTAPSFPSTLIGTVSSATTPAVFAEGQMVDLTPIMYVAVGGSLKYANLDTSAVVTPSPSPTASFITNLNNRFYANDTAGSPQDFWITDYNPSVGAGDPTYWASTNNPFRAAQKPDNLIGIYSAFNEVYLWGSQGCEIWQEDGITPISPLVGSIIEAGLSAPYSVVMTNNTFFALCNVSGKRAVVMLNGRAPKVISEPIANKLQELSVVTDAIGNLCYVGGLNMYTLTFPTDGVTWAYDFKSETWSQWSSWEGTVGSHAQFNGRYGVYAKAWNQHYVLGKTGNLYSLSRDVFSDAGSTIRSSVRTGWVDHGTWDRKRSDQLIIKLKGYLTDSAILMMRFRDDGRYEWSNTMEFELQAGTQNDFLIKLNRMGTYRSRQYEFIMTDAQNLALLGMEEDVTKMRY